MLFAVLYGKEIGAGTRAEALWAQHGLLREEIAGQRADGHRPAWRLKHVDSTHRKCAFRQSPASHLCAATSAV
jgi:hypothetical protein